MEKLLGKNLKTKENEDYQIEKIEDIKLFGFYFGAGFCPPSLNFTKTLISFYKEMNITEKIIEIIYVPYDKDENQYKAHIENMPFLRYQFQEALVKELIQKFNITGIPKLLIFDNKGKLLSSNGRREVCIDGEEALIKWLELV